MKFIVTTLTSWTAVPHCVRRKTTSNDVCFESSKPAVVNHGQSSQDSNNVKTKVQPSSMQWETVASTIRVAPASSKSSSGCSGQQQSYVNTTEGKVLLREEERDPQRGQNLGLWFQDARNAKGIPFKLASPSVLRKKFDTMIKMNEKQMERCIGMLHFQYWKEYAKINWRKSSRTRIGSIAFILEAAKQGLKSVQVKMEN